MDAIIIRDYKILLVKRKYDPYKNLWALPGGHLEFDETLEEAISREVDEETGLKSFKLSLFRVYSDPNRHPKQAIAVVYFAITEGDLCAGDDASEVKYFLQKEVPHILAFDHAKIISDFFSAASLEY